MKQKFFGKCFLPLLMIAEMMFSACKVDNIVYLQDLTDGASNTILNPKKITLQPDDKISIFVKSKNPQLTELFNITNPTINSSTTQRYYTVDSEGNIDFPVLGTVRVGGYTREEVAEIIKKKLIESDQLKDPVVIVEYENLHIYMLGEVAKTGVQNIDRSSVTILEAITLAGDLTINGNRENITVLRNEGNQQKVYTVNLNSGYDLLSSPVYYLKQNDIVYVQPNEMRQRQSPVNGNSLYSITFWTSLTTLPLTIATMIVSLTKK